jgi:hypothetical protein
LLSTYTQPIKLRRCDDGSCGYNSCNFLRKDLRVCVHTNIFTCLDAQKSCCKTWHIVVRQPVFMVFPCNNILIDLSSLNYEKLYNLISILIMRYKVALSPCVWITSYYSYY